MSAIAAQENLELILDVETAFLYCILEDEIYMRVHEGYHATENIFLLEKALYGRKRAPLQWNKCFYEFMKKENLIQLSTKTQTRN